MKILWLVFEGTWHVLLAGLILGAGLPTLFALGVRSLSMGTRGDPAQRPSLLGEVVTGLCFAVVLPAVLVGIVTIVAHGLGVQSNFDGVIPVLTSKQPSRGVTGAASQVFAHAPGKISPLAYESRSPDGSASVDSEGVRNNGFWRYAVRLDERCRGLMLVLLGRGRSCHLIARELGGSPSTMRKVAAEAGVVLSQGRVGGVSGLNEHRYSPRRRRRWLRENPVLEVGEPAQWCDGQGRLILTGRISIEVRVGDRVPPSWIIAESGVHRSTVSREVRRCPGRYRAQPARRPADQSCRRPKDRKLMLGTSLWDGVVTRLNNKHSPQQITHRLRQDFPEDPTMWVNHETIYQTLYVQVTGGLGHELTVKEALRSGRTTRGLRSRLSGRGSRSWIGEATITNRPAEVEDRAVPEHREGDLIIGKDGTSALVTLNERATRYTMIQRATSRDSTTVADALIQMARRLPATLMTTLTWDQGIEMAQYVRFTFTSGCQAYFYDPHSPWQRPTSENSNGLIRDFFPKGTNFTHITDTQVQHAKGLLNIRPRRVLDWATPAEKMEQLLNVTHTT